MTEQQLTSALDLTEGRTLSPELAAAALAQARGVRRRRRAITGVGIVAISAAGATVMVTRPTGAPTRPAAIVPAEQPSATTAVSPVPPPIPTSSSSTDVTDAELAAAQWFSVRSEGRDGPRTIWLSRTGPGVLDEPRFGAVEPVSNQDGNVVLEDLRQRSWAELAALPSTPDALRAAVAVPGRPDLADKSALDLISEAPTPTAVRQAAVELLEEDGHVTAGVRDERGRPAVRISGSPVPGTLWIDPVTFRLLDVKGEGWHQAYVSWGTDAPRAIPLPAAASATG